MKNFITLSILILSTLHLSSQTDYNLDSLIVKSYPEEEVQEKIIYTYDNLNRLIREENFETIKIYDHSIENQISITEANIAEPFVVLFKEVHKLDNQGRLIVLEKYDVNHTEQSLTAVDSITYTTNDDRFNKKRSYIVYEGFLTKIYFGEWYSVSGERRDSFYSISFTEDNIAINEYIKKYLLDNQQRDSVYHASFYSFFQDSYSYDTSYFSYTDNQEIENDYSFNDNNELIRHLENVTDFEDDHYSHSIYSSTGSLLFNKKFYYPNSEIQDFVSFDSIREIIYQINQVELQTLFSTSLEILDNVYKVSSIRTRYNPYLTESYYTSKSDVVDNSGSELSQFNILPNPAQANGESHILCKTPYDKIRIYDVLGAIVDEINVIQTTQTKINLPEKKGLFFIRLYDGNELVSYTQKIILEN